MAVEQRRSSWPDERLDDLNLAIREGFSRTEQDLRVLGADLRSFRTEVNERFDRQNERFDSLNRMLIVGLFGIVAVLVAGLIALA